MARILVRDAAATTASRQKLYKLLAAHLQSAKERRQFLLSGERSATGPGVTPVGVPSGPLKAGLGPSQPLTTEATQRACQILARYIGPIATIVTRKAAQTAADEGQFYALLAEKVAERRAGGEGARAISPPFRGAAARGFAAREAGEQPGAARGLWPLAGCRVAA